MKASYVWEFRGKYYERKSWILPMGGINSGMMSTHHPKNSNLSVIHLILHLVFCMFLSFFVSAEDHQDHLQQDIPPNPHHLRRLHVLPRWAPRRPAHEMLRPAPAWHSPNDVAVVVWGVPARRRRLIHTRKLGWEATEGCCQ